MPDCRLQPWLRGALIAGAVAGLSAAGLVGAAGHARAAESPNPTCWGPQNNASDCPDYSAMNPYAYGRYYDRRGYGYYRDAPGFWGYGSGYSPRREYYYGR